MSQQGTALNVRSIAAPERRTIGLQLPERQVLLGAVDLFCINAALAIVAEWRGYPLGEGLALQPVWYGVLTGVWLTVAYLLGSYDLRRAAQIRAGVATGAATGLITGIAYLFTPHIIPALPASPLMLATFLTAMVVPVTCWRAIYALALVGPTLRRRALVVGAGWAGQTIVETLRKHAPVEYDLVGFIDDDPDKWGKIIADLKVLGTRANLHRLVKQTGATEIIIAVAQPGRIHPDLLQAILHCHEQGIHITQMPVLFEQLTGRVPVEHAGRNMYVVLPVNGYPSHVQAAVKRLVDLVIGTSGLVLTAALLPLVWLALHIESPGPVFYRQMRVGRGGRLFDLIKFRTMVPNAEVRGARWAEVEDRRVTRVGRWMRRLHLDEIPQALNIVRGDLSFIGPRPERPEFVAQLEEHLPFYRVRQAVRPGVTGWAQIKYRYGASVEDALMKLEYDLYYNKHQSLWLDLVILIKTIGIVLTLKGR